MEMVKDNTLFFPKVTSSWGEILFALTADINNDTYFIDLRDKIKGNRRIWKIRRRVSEKILFRWKQSKI